jgi:hypothetical protein
MPVLFCLVLLGLAFEVARAHAQVGGEMTGPYRAGPLAQREAPVELEWPAQGEELLVLGGITAILCGFRASGLARGRTASKGVSMRARRVAGR